MSGEINGVTRNVPIIRDIDGFTFVLQSVHLEIVKQLKQQIEEKELALLTIRSLYNDMNESYIKLKEELEKCGTIITCVNCGEKTGCEYAFDSYNTNGDCLAEK